MPDVPRRLEANGLRIEERRLRACIALRGDARDARFVRAVESVTDLRPPAEPCTSASGLLASILWLGPDEWLVASDAQGGDALHASLVAALRGIAAAAVDVSDARIVYAVSGPNARHLLAKGCALDLHERVFAAGACAQTLLAKAPVLLRRSAAEAAFEVYVARSLRDYAWDWLRAAADEYAAVASG